jgi:AraC-like DNA-binding protein
MAGTLVQRGEGRLEGLCEPRPGRACIRIGPHSDGVERLEACFLGRAFEPHRHDTYAIGITLAGIQAFRYRGEQRHCLPGQCHILHPDELHDGAAGSDVGFAYRIVYIDPALIQQALGGRTLPFVADPVIDLPQPARARLSPAWDMESSLDEISRVDLLVAIADMLAVTSCASADVGTLRLAALSAVRDRIAADPAAWPSAAALERLSGLDRWTLARQFRAAFGTSPSRFRTMRQLDHTRSLIARGTPLAEAAVAAGFADQSHMSRQFKRAYGLTPGQWTAALDRRDIDVPTAPPARRLCEHRCQISVGRPGASPH